MQSSAVRREGEDLSSRPAAVISTTVRKKRLRSRTIGPCVRVLAVIFGLALLLTYVGMTTKLAAQTYRLADARDRRSRLIQFNDEQREKIARLQSLPRLQAAAAKLRMAEASHFAVVSMPIVRPPKRARTFAARLEGLTHWAALR